MHSCVSVAMAAAGGADGKTFTTHSKFKVREGSRGGAAGVALIF